MLPHLSSRSEGHGSDSGFASPDSVGQRRRTEDSGDCYSGRDITFIRRGRNLCPQLGNMQATKKRPRFTGGVSSLVADLLLAAVVLVFLDLVRQLGLLFVDLSLLGRSQLATIGRSVSLNLAVDIGFLLLQMAGLASR